MQVMRGIFAKKKDRYLSHTMFGTHSSSLESEVSHGRCSKVLIILRMQIYTKKVCQISLTHSYLAYGL